MDTADAPAPPPRRKWFYRDPNSGEPAVTTVMSVQVGGEKRWVLAQLRIDEGDDFIVSDSAGRIPVFESREDADGYIARWFPLAGGDSSKDAGAKEYGRMLAVGSPLHVDLDAAARWASNPHAREVGPIQLLRVWRTLASADAVLPPMQFDPMGMAAVAEHMDRDDDRAANERALTGMRLTAIATAFRMDHGPLRDNAPWPSDTVIWTNADDLRLARLLRAGLANFSSRLSSEAGRSDVSATWPRPESARFTATVAPSVLAEIEGLFYRKPLPTATELDASDRESLAGGIGPDAQRDRLSPAALERYRRDFREYLAEQRAYRMLTARLEDEGQRTIRLRLWIRNDGDRSANDVRVRLRVPPGVTVLPSGSEGNYPAAPASMPSTAEYENPRTKRAHVMPTLRPGSRELGHTSLYNAHEQLRRAPDGSTVVEGLGLIAVGAHDGGDLQEVLLFYPTWASVRPISIEVEIEAQGVPTSVSRVEVAPVVRHPDP